MKKPKIIVILGPTAVGKSDLAVKLAKKFSARGGSALGGNGAEIISADSRQVYKGIDLLSGKITKKEMSGIKHYLLDVASPKSIFTVSRFKKMADKAIKEILSKGKLPIICGGTPFYIDALVKNQQLPEARPDFNLRAKLDKLSPDALFKRLKNLDPGRAKNIDRYNKRRLIRALEIIIKTGSKIPKINFQPKYDCLLLGVYKNPRELKIRIEKRLLERLKQGMAQEIERLRKQGVSWKRLYDLGLECRYVSLFVKGEISRDEMIDFLKKEIWHFVRRQMTWWKRDKSIKWIADYNSAFRKISKFVN